MPLVLMILGGRHVYAAVWVEWMLARNPIECESPVAEQDGPTSLGWQLRGADARSAALVRSRVLWGGRLWAAILGGQVLGRNSLRDVDAARKSDRARMSLRIRMQNQRLSLAWYVSLILFGQAEYYLVFEEANSFPGLAET